MPCRVAVSVALAGHERHAGSARSQPAPASVAQQSRASALLPHIAAGRRADLGGGEARRRAPWCPCSPRRRGAGSRGSGGEATGVHGPPSRRQRWTWGRAGGVWSLGGIRMHEGWAGRGSGGSQHALPPHAAGCTWRASCRCARQIEGEGKKGGPRRSGSALSPGASSASAELPASAHTHTHTHTHTSVSANADRECRHALAASRVCWYSAALPCALGSSSRTEKRGGSAGIRASSSLLSMAVPSSSSSCELRGGFRKEEEGSTRQRNQSQAITFLAQNVRRLHLIWQRRRGKEVSGKSSGKEGGGYA
eukprot:2451923-Rhodomonas_salina.1